MSMQVPDTLAALLAPPALGSLEAREKAITQVILPLKESLHKVDTRIQDLEKVRAGAYAGLSEQIKSLLTTQGQLEAQTGHLVRALRAPAIGGPPLSESREPR